MNFLALGLIIPLTACSFSWDANSEDTGASASGARASRTFQVTDFNGIDLRSADDVDVRVGTDFSVRAEGPTEQLDRLKIDRDGETLDIARKTGTSAGWSKGPGVKIFVTLPRLTAATVSGSGYLGVDRVEGKSFKGGIAGSGDLFIAAIRVDEARLSVTGSGSLRVTGTARDLTIEVTGSGDVDAAKLQAKSAEVEMAGSGSVRAVVDGPAKIGMTGSGDVDLGPKARCTIAKMGSGSVRCGN